jgi:adenylyl-sulfate kinase
MNKGFVLWFTGIPCSGKTTLINALLDKYDKTLKMETLDGDYFRKHVTKDLGFSPEDRKKNIEVAKYTIRYLISRGYIVLAGFVSPNREVRDNLKKEFGEGFKEIYVKCSSLECAKRDVKGMWKLAKEGKIKNFTGFSANYEEPLNPDLVIDTELNSNVIDNVRELSKLLDCNLGDYYSI